MSTAMLKNKRSVRGHEECVSKGQQLLQDSGHHHRPECHSIKEYAAETLLPPQPNAVAVMLTLAATRPQPKSLSIPSVYPAGFDRLLYLISRKQLQDHVQSLQSSLLCLRAEVHELLILPGGDGRAGHGLVVLVEVPGVIVGKGDCWKAGLVLAR